MNITFVLFYYLPERPTQNYIYQPIIDALLALGHRVNIITPNPTRGISKEEQKKYRKINYEKHGNLHIYRVNAFIYNPIALASLNYSYAIYLFPFAYPDS